MYEVYCFRPVDRLSNDKSSALLHRDDVVKLL